MKTYCKNVDLLDINFIRPFVNDCILDKIKRFDYALFLSDYCDYSPSKIRKLNPEDLKEPIERVCEHIIFMFYIRKLTLPPVRYSSRYDDVSRKTRVIGVESVMQQVLEHVVVGAMSELWNAKLEPHQYASRKEKGQVKGAKKIQSWIKDANLKGKHLHFDKLDIKKCFPSIKHTVVMKFLRRDVRKNELLLWAVEALLQYHNSGLLNPIEETDDGLIIGSLLSQFLCNYLLSYAYRHVQSLHKIRRGKSVKLVEHAIFYMDDICLMSFDKRNLGIATNSTIKYIGDNLELEIKPDWQIKDNAKEPIDMMGYRMFGDGSMDIRPRIFIRARRCFMRGYKWGFTIKTARRACSYYGYFKHTGIKTLKMPNRVVLDIVKLKQKASKVISTYDKGENYVKQNRIYSNA